MSAVSSALSSSELALLRSFLDRATLSSEGVGGGVVEVVASDGGGERGVRGGSKVVESGRGEKLSVGVVDGVGAGVAVDVLSVSSGSVGSWSDAVEEELDLTSGVVKDKAVEGVVVGDEKVSMPGEFARFDSSVRCVRFGGLADVYGAVQQPVGGVEPGFYASFVHVPKVKGYRKWLEVNVGVKLPRAAAQDLALVSYARGCVPDQFKDGQARLRGLEQVGDAALSLAVTTRLVCTGQAVSSVQAVKSRVLTNAAMSSAAERVGMSQFLVVPSGVSLSGSKVGADALEALVGVVSMWRGFVDVQRVVAFLGF